MPLRTGAALRMQKTMSGFSTRVLNRGCAVIKRPLVTAALNRADAARESHRQFAGEFLFRPGDGRWVVIDDVYVGWRIEVKTFGRYSRSEHQANYRLLAQRLPVGIHKSSDERFA
jgi:hypothetical protein